MRIGIDARIIAYRRGGITNYIRHLLPALAALDPDTDYRVLRHRKDRTRSEAAPNVPPRHRLDAVPPPAGTVGPGCGDCPPTPGPAS
jgi:hypothetical protein